MGIKEFSKIKTFLTNKFDLRTCVKDFKFDTNPDGLLIDVQSIIYTVLNSKKTMEYLESENIIEICAVIAKEIYQQVDFLLCYVTQHEILESFKVVISFDGRAPRFKLAEQMRRRQYILTQYMKIENILNNSIQNMPKQPADDSTFYNNQAKREDLITSVPIELKQKQLLYQLCLWYQSPVISQIILNLKNYILDDIATMVQAGNWRTKNLKISISTNNNIGEGESKMFSLAIDSGIKNPLIYSVDSDVFLYSWAGLNKYFESVYIMHGNNVPTEYIFTFPNNQMQSNYFKFLIIPTLLLGNDFLPSLIGSSDKQIDLLFDVYDKFLEGYEDKSEEGAIEKVEISELAFNFICRYMISLFSQSQKLVKYKLEDDKNDKIGIMYWFAVLWTCDYIYNHNHETDQSIHFITNELIHVNGNVRPMILDKFETQYNVEPASCKIDFDIAKQDYENTKQMSIEHHLDDPNSRVDMRNSLVMNFLNAHFPQPVDINSDYIIEHTFNENMETVVP
jgi:XRN 5'-3' exonuclease N-terminus